jgi:hypothetical protein
MTNVPSGNVNIDLTKSGYTGGLFSIQPGYDMATGLGSPNVANLAPVACTTVVRTPPSAPQEIQTQSTTTGINASWTPPANANGQALQYTVSVSRLPQVGPTSSTTGQVADSFQTTNTSATITGLTQGDAYTVSVSDTNAIGTSSSITSSEVVAGVIAPLPSVYTGGLVSLAATPDGAGYYALTRQGQVYAFGTAKWYGDPAGDQGACGAAAAAGIFDSIATSSTGYVALARNGSVCNFNAAWMGKINTNPATAPAVQIAYGPGDTGYLILTSSGHLYIRGHLRFEGSPFARYHGRLSTRAVGVAINLHSSPSRPGYWVALANGAVLSFGNAPFRGSPLRQYKRTHRWYGAIEAIINNGYGATGYRVVTYNGSVYNFGIWHNLRWTYPRGIVIAAASAPQGGNFLLAQTTGAIWGYGPIQAILGLSLHGSIV